MQVDSLMSYLERRPLSVSLVHRAHVPRDFRMEWDIHEGLEMVLHRTGGGMVAFGDGSSNPFAPGTIEIYSPRLPHKLVPDAEGDEYFFQVDPIPEFAHFMGSSLGVVGPPNAVLEHDFIEITRPLEDPTRRAVAERNHRATALLLRILPHAQQRQASPSHSLAERQAHEARRYIRDKARSLRFIDEVAHALDISHTHLRHVFKQTFGHSLIRELIEARLDLATQELRGTSDTLAVIARRCGLESENYLCRVHRRLRGTTPGSLRRRSTAKKSNR
jgi:AraC-like DNA-binding protein